MSGVYIHIPFCKQACHYCDFHFSTNRSSVTEMVTSLGHEIQLQKEYLNEPVTTVYLGGGTPSLLNRDQIDLLKGSVMQHLGSRHLEEFTLEANPDDLSAEKIEQWVELGINRLSVGIQSFDDKALQLMNRAHDSSTAKKCLELLQQTGFRNVSIDLIHSIPGQSEKDWLRSLDAIVDFRPQHISAYALTIEERTVFGSWVKARKLVPVIEEQSARQFELLINVLEQAGYDHYEISNFALPGFAARHNTNYWKGLPYLGIGPSAHSYNGKSRQWNIRNNVKYMKSIEEGKVPFESERLSRENKINEYILMSLRTKWGCDLEWLNKKYDYNIPDKNPSYLERLTSGGLAEMRGSTLVLLKPGKLVADQIALDLFLPA